jgi:hypothetical protein
VNISFYAAPVYIGNVSIKTPQQKVEDNGDSDIQSYP